MARFGPAGKVLGLSHSHLHRKIKSKTKNQELFVGASEHGGHGATAAPKLRQTGDAEVHS